MEEEINKPVKTFTYRGITIDIYADDYGQSLFTFFPWEPDKPVSFGSYNADFEEDAKFLIDEHLDVITRNFGEEFFGACLRWFNNGGYRDIQLTYRMRILKVYTVVIPADLNMKAIETDAWMMLKKAVPIMKGSL